MLSNTCTRTVSQTLGTTALLVSLIGSQLGAQRLAETSIVRPLSAPDVKIATTPLTVTVAWRAVDGAESYTVERAASPAGPWSILPLDPRAGNQVTVPSYGGTANLSGGVLHYYRITALGPSASPGVTVVPRVTPPLGSPLGVEVREDGADLWVSWAPAPHAAGYVVTASLGQQLPPTHTVAVDARYSEARLASVLSPNTPLTVWVFVAARYEPGNVLSVPASRQINLPSVQECWPPAGAVLGPTSGVRVGATPTSIAIASNLTVTGPPGVIRVERAPMDTQAWQAVGCRSGTVMDKNLAPGTQFQYRVTENAPASLGQAIVVAATRLVPDSPTPTASIFNCTPTACGVTLTWNHGAVGADDYRIESSYGLYLSHTGKPMPTGKLTVGTPISVAIMTVPKGVHTFWLTPLFPSWRPSPRPPGQVTVTVP